MTSQFSDVQNNLKNAGYEDLIEAMSVIADRNPYDDMRRTTSISRGDAHKMWLEQTHLNFPLLYLASLYLYKHAEAKGCKVFLFATRDACHWHRIFKAMFPQTICHYLHCSRNMFSIAGMLDRTVETPYDKYVKSLYAGHDLKHVVYVDLHGSGQHVMNYFRRRFSDTPNVFLLSMSRSDYEHLPTVTKKFPGRLFSLLSGFTGGPIEMLNYDTQGTLQNFSSDGKPIRDKPEYDLDMIFPYHQCMDLVVNSLRRVKDNILDDLSFRNLEESIHYIFKTIYNYRSVINHNFQHIGRHKKTKEKTKK